LNTIGAEIKIEGYVQGVGFRFYCHRVACALNIKGWVKNNSDGSVSVRAEADRGQIEELISKLKTGPSSATVKDIKIRWLPYTGEFKSFEVVR
jgi:acylphosphatase